MYPKSPSFWMAFIYSPGSLFHFGYSWPQLGHSQVLSPILQVCLAVIDMTCLIAIHPAFRRECNGCPGWALLLVKQEHRLASVLVIP